MQCSLEYLEDSKHKHNLLTLDFKLSNIDFDDSSDKTGKFPDYPDDDEGGSAAIFKMKDPAEVRLLLNLYKYCQNSLIIWQNCLDWFFKSLGFPYGQRCR